MHNQFERQSTTAQKDSKRKHRIGRWIGAVLLLLLLILIFVIISNLRSTNYIRDDEVEVMTELLETESEIRVKAEDIYHLDEVTPVSEEELADTWTLLVIGEGKEGEDWREKALRAETETETGTGEPVDESHGTAQGVITMTINHRKKQVYFYSFHKDLYVQLEQYGGQHLGNVYAAGGGPLLMKTLESNYGIHIDQYAAIQLDNVAKILQMDEFSDMDISNGGIDVIENLVFSMKEIAPAKMAGYVSKLLPYVSHNMNDVEMMRMILQIPKVVQYSSVKGKIPYEGMYEEIDGYLVPQIGETSDHMKSVIYGS